MVKVALREIEPLALNALRFPFAVLTLGVLLRLQGRRLIPRRKDWGKVVVLGVVGHAAFQICFIFALDLTLAGNAALLLSTSPVWVVLISTGLGRERFSSAVLFGALATLAGMGLLITGGPNPLGGSAWGDLLMVAAAVFWALYTVLGRRAIKRHGALEMTAWTLWAGTPLVFAAGLPGLWRTGLVSLSLGTWAAIAYAGVLAISVAYFLWYRGVGTIGQNRTAVYTNLVPVVALVMAWLWLGETPTPRQLAGVGVILAGLVVARRGRWGRTTPGPARSA